MSDFIGPSISCERKPVPTNEAKVPIGPVLPSQSKEIGPVEDQIGPSLPPHLEKNLCDSQLPAYHRKTDSTLFGKVEQIGPALPPHFQKDAGKVCDDDEEEFGPALPPGFANKSKQKVVGPQIPPGLLTYEVKY